MSKKLGVFLNGQSVIEYDRNIRLPGHQRQYLDKMDLDMDAGIEINGQFSEKPDIKQKAQFVAMHLVQSILNDNEAMIAATCAYLASRLPDLKKIQAEEQGENVSIDLVFNDEESNKVAVQFEPGINTRH